MSPALALAGILALIGVGIAQYLEWKENHRD